MAKDDSIPRAFYRLHDEVLASRALVDAMLLLDGDRGTAWLHTFVLQVHRLEQAATRCEAAIAKGGAK